MSRISSARDRAQSVGSDIRLTSKRAAAAPRSLTRARGDCRAGSSTRSIVRDASPRVPGGQTRGVLAANRTSSCRTDVLGTRRDDLSAVTGRAYICEGAGTDDLSVVATDHCPFCFKEQKELGRGDFSKIPNGVPEVEHRMDLLYQGVLQGKLSLSRWVEVTAAAPARMFGMYPKKGSLQPGSDADIVIYDPTARWTISAATHHMSVDYSCYEGMEVTGQVETVLLRGSVVLDKRTYVGTQSGRFVARGLCQYAR